VRGLHSSLLLRLSNIGLFLGAALVLATACVSAPAQALAAGSSYYVDCNKGSDGANGRSPSTAWKNLRRVNQVTFQPGDSILLKRGTTCKGMLAPRGSGTAGSPITIDAYGAGTLPRILAGTSSAAIRLFDQQQWEISHVETVGGNPRGIFIGADNGTYTHFRITNVTVVGVGGTATEKGSGLIDIEPNYGTAGRLTDVVVDGASAFNTKQWMGIHISCIGSDQPSTTPDNVAIRNSTVHDVGGDGITIFSCNGATIENNVAYNTGQFQADTIGTPNAIWTWACANCTVQGNEGYASHSPADDGGIYDIDFHSSNTTVQYNYGHDADGYCLAVFGAVNQATTNSVVRYNVCSNNAREASIAGQGDVAVSSWDNGSLDGVQIYNNTFYWNPAANAPLLMNDAVFSGAGADVFENNLIYSTVSNFENSVAGLHLDHNLWWTTAGGGPSWTYAAHTYTTFASYKSGSGQDAAGLFADPLLSSPTYHGVGKPTSQFLLQAGSPAIDAGANLGSMGSHDFFGDPIPDGAAYDIGADER
jgi:hypothetical protein